MNINIKNPDKYIKINAWQVPVRRYDAIVVGSGAAGFGCAYALFEEGVPTDKLAIISEGRMMGTSRNTGSDKQTYYKLASNDSAAAMAKDMLEAGSMHGDLAYVEAVNSLRGFHRLTTMGVPFPHDEYGNYTGYRTDHDTAGRATSCGPLTSKYMTEALERETTAKNIPFYDRTRAVRILTHNGYVNGVLTISENDVSSDNEFGYAVFETQNIVLAVGGPSAIYEATVYPESQTCALGLAFEAGAEGANLTESQYGLASVAPRWNVSGSYQQVIPRYISTGENGGDVREFLSDYIDSPRAVLESIFKKGYEWPFSPARVKSASGYLSSAVDLAVFSEKCKGRRVFLDFLHNPSELNVNGKTELAAAGDEAYSYLVNCGATGETPIERLAEMNKPAIELYASFGVDLYSEPLEIAVCAQHCNGGVAIDKWYESDVGGLFVIGEAAGVFGVQRPGGSALNSTQVGGIRAAEMIAHRLEKKQNIALYPVCGEEVTLFGDGDDALTFEEVYSKRMSFARRLTESCSFLRRPTELAALLSDVKAELSAFSRYKVCDARSLRELYIYRDVLLTQLMMLNAVHSYINSGGSSRGSYLITDEATSDILSGTPPVTDTAFSSKVIKTKLVPNGKFDAETYFEAVRPVPETAYWFEKVYNAYRNGEIFDN